MNSYFSSRGEIATDKNLIDQLSEAFKINKVMASIMHSRGLTDYNSFERFLNSGSHNFNDPFLLKNMHQAVEKINFHIANNSNITIYGDYDADGICSVSILYLYFLNRGINISWYIPEREEGYGINKDAVDFIVEAYKPNLLISVDCGITAVEEVDYIKSLGIDIIVTDHHNCQSKLPDCIFINPKISPNYPFKDLCGAGVALKLVEALSGREESLKYIDIATIATIADSVELFGENRDIVTEGLKFINSTPRNGIVKLCEVALLSGEINTYTVAFNIVPRINAAGRIGEAKRALALFVETDFEKLQLIADELNNANIERQQICEKIIANATKQIDESEIITKRVIAIIDDSGQHGVSGIIASRLCDSYYRPSFVFCLDGENTIKGSGRSVEGVNIFDMLTSMSDLFVRFGGHAYAAGLTLKKENFQEFIKRADKYLSNPFFNTLFLKRQKFDYDITNTTITDKFVRELDCFEPCGVGNPRPKFLYRANKINAQSLTKHPKHISFKVNEITVMGFNYGSYLDIFKGEGENALLLEFKTNWFNGKLYSKGFIKDFICSNSIMGNFEDRIAINFINRFTHRNGDFTDYKTYKYENLGALLDSNIETFGTLLVAGSENTLIKFKNSFPSYSYLDVVFFDTANRSNSTKIVFAPDGFSKFAGYRKIIFLDSPLAKEYLDFLKDEINTIYIPEDSFTNHNFLTNFDLSRSVFAEYYNKIVKCINKLKQPCDNSLFFNIVASFYENIDIVQLCVCFSVFMDLKIINRDKEGYLSIDSSIKRPLEYSQLYNKLNDLKIG